MEQLRITSIRLCPRHALHGHARSTSPVASQKPLCRQRLFQFGTNIAPREPPKGSAHTQYLILGENMNKHIIAAAVLALMSATAAAQVTIYGTIDTSVVNLNKFNPAGQSNSLVASSVW